MSTDQKILLFHILGKKYSKTVPHYINKTDNPAAICDICNAYVLDNGEYWYGYCENDICLKCFNIISDKKFRKLRN